MSKTKGQKIHNLEYPDYLNKIFNKLKINNIKPIVIGGFVRDYLLNISSKQDSKDIDIELYGVSSYKILEDILSEFGDVNSVGKSFGVCKLRTKELDIDFTLPRLDNKVSSGHRGFEVKTDKDLDFKSATSRRDFTINAIGYDVIQEKFLDPFNGKEDLKNKILKAVNIKTFAEDPLRVLRAAQFASRFNLTLDSELFILCKDMCDNNLLDELPRERIFAEIKKIVLKSPKPSIGFNILKELNALKYLSHFELTIQALDTIDKPNIVLMLSILCAKLTKEQTIEFISKLSDEKKLLKNVLSLVMSDFKTSYNDSELLALATKVNIKQFLIFHKAINNSINSEIFEEIRLRAKKLNILNKKAPPYLQGRDILACGIKPSLEYSIILKDAYDAQINLEIKSHKEALKWLNNYLLLSISITV